MRKVVLVLGAFAVVFVGAGVLVLTVPPLRDEASWRWAAFQGGEADYASYLRERPHGRHAAEALRRLDDKAWQRARAASTMRGFQSYLLAYSHGRHARAAREHIDTLHWTAARDANTIQSYQVYLRVSAGGAHVAEARKRSRELRWQRAAKQIATLACGGEPSRRVPLYRAPSLFSTLDVAMPSPRYISYSVSISSAPAQGFRQLVKSPCKQLEVLGAAGYAVSDESGQPRGKWAFVAIEQEPSMRGWVYIANAFARGVEWRLAPRVEADTLLEHPTGLPDLVFGAHTQAYHAGESCFGMGDVNVWDLVLRNEGAGAGPTVAKLRIAPGVPLYVNGRTVNTTRVVTLRFARPWLPGETVVVRGIPFQARVELDPGGAVRESNEGNNSISLYQPSFYLTCE